MTSPGNHEADCQEIDYTSFLCPEGQSNFTDFMIRFGHTMPATFPSQSKNATLQASAKQAAGLANPPFWYSFEYGMAHIVMFDTETDFKSAPDGPNGSANRTSTDGERRCDPRGSHVVSHLTYLSPFPTSETLANPLSFAFSRWRTIRRPRTTSAILASRSRRR